MTREGPDDLSVAVPGGTVFARRWRGERADLAPVVLLHDSLGSVEQWREFPAALARATRRTVMAYDRLGFGRSSARTGLPAPGFVREEAERYFPALADALGLSSYVPFGHSVGGSMALTLATTDAARCVAVITEAAQPFVEERTLEGIRAAQDAFRDPAQFARLAKWHGDKARWVLDAWTETWLSPERRAWTLDDVLGSVRCPVLVIHGDRDEFGSAAFPRRIAAGVGGAAELRILADCGHVPHREREADVLRLAATFLGEKP